MTDDSPQDKQDNEVEALKAIFGDDLKDLRSSNSEWEPIDVMLSLFPQQGSTGLQESHCTIVLHITCSSNYPQVEPKLEINSSKGLSDVKKKDLLEQLHVLSSSLKGEVMIFDLAQHTQTFLHEHNKPGIKSFYDEMLVRQKQNEQNMLLDKQVKEDKERQKIAKEILYRKEILKQEMKLVKESQIGITVDGYDPSNILPTERMRTSSYKRQKQFSTESSDDVSCDHRNVTTIDFNLRGNTQISRGSCLGHSDSGHVIYNALDMTNGSLLIVIEWIFHTRLNYKPSPQRQLSKTKTDSPVHSPKQYLDYNICVKQIASIEQEMSFLIKLDHPNLAQYLNIKHTDNNNKIIVDILQEFISGVSLSTYLHNSNVTLDLDMLRHFANGLLNAVNYLHNNNVVHKDIRLTNIFMDNSGNIRLADYSIHKRLLELNQNTDQNIKYSKKQDIFRVGVIFLSLWNGKIVADDRVELPSNLPQDFKDFLSKCLEKNERERWSSDQLLKHQFLKISIPRSLPNRSNDQSKETSDDAQNNLPEGVDMESFIPTGLNSQSRIKNEFELLKWLGKGAFGDVLKVRNKLDGGIYAIKRIELNPRNKILNKKITREVKLLSRLNHENVVRYYNSWIESGFEKRDFDGSNTSTVITESIKTSTNTANVQNPSFSFDKYRDIEKFTSPPVEWSVSYTCNSKKSKALSGENSFNDDSSDSEDDNDDDDGDDDDWNNFFAGIKKSSESESIEFVSEETSGCKENDDNASSETDKINSDTTSLNSTNNTVQIQYLYIQMEFCEKSTLRNAIDNNLYMDNDRMWRLFREIVEGLSHIHQQGMIHRDLKPVNIFLDSDDNVKIGDFGLATNINISSKMNQVLDLKSNPETDSFSNVGDGSMTGLVGTALYVAPELIKTDGKSIYNQKVDLYSLGIILFEMCFMPLNTGMERVKILGNLRLHDIVLPESFITPENTSKIKLIRWLLNHDGASRPTCAELLQCDQLASTLEENELRDVLHHAFSNKNSNAYRHLINTCFQQELTPAENITYDMNCLKSSAPHHKQSVLTSYVKDIVEKIFKLHGGIELSTPLLLPLCHLYDLGESSVRLMTHGGEIVNIPHDLRVPFARYIAWNKISTMKRYSIEKVYREKRLQGFHPREFYECSFDIVTPNQGSLLAEAELLSIVHEITNELPAFKYKNLCIKLNHTSLLKAVLMECGIKNEKHGDVYNILSHSKLSKFQIRTHLMSLCLSDQAMLGLVKFMETECAIEKLPHALKGLIRKRGEANLLAKEGIKELETIIRNSEALGVKCPIVISPCMVYKINQYSGMMCKFVCELKKKRRKGGLEEIAAGGRYDKMLNNLRKMFHDTDSEGRCAAGISLSLEQLVLGATTDCEDLDFCNLYDVYVCSMSSSTAATRDKAQIATTLWNAGINANLIEIMNIHEVEEMCRDSSNVLIIIADTEPCTVHIKSRDNRFDKRKVNVEEIVELVQSYIKADTDATGYSNSASFSNLPAYKNENERSSIGMPNISISFHTPEKLAANTKRRYEHQIKVDLKSVVQRFTPKTTVKVLAFTLDSSVLRTLASFIDVTESDCVEDKTVRMIIEKHPRHKKYLLEICEIITDIIAQENTPILALYSLQDSVYKIMM